SRSGTEWRKRCSPSLVSRWWRPGTCSTCGHRHGATCPKTCPKTCLARSTRYLAQAMSDILSPARTLTVNGETRRSSAATVADLVRELSLKPEKVAVEHNGIIVPRSTLADTPLSEGDVLEIVHFVGGGDHAATVSEDDGWTVAGRRFRSRLIVGTGKYKDFAQNAAAVEASGAEIVTVAVRRV